ncbi:MAG: BTAD domain-containing putative transcriptional regulator [Longimicrobiales bacterium]
MTIRLSTFGGLRVAGEDGELDSLLGRRLRAALFVYLAVERRASRASVASIFWPERDEEQARHALRQGLYDLRKALGGDWLDATAHEIRVGRGVRVDAHAFTQAIERGQVQGAAELYAGPFLDGMHLVDQRPWETWVEGRRAEYGRSFRRACREWLSSMREAGDLAGAIAAAQHWLAPDPFDDEAQHKLIEALAEGGERTEALRQYEMYARLLEPDGLRPLDDTVALIERIRSESAAWPNDVQSSVTAPVPDAHESTTAAPAPITPAPESGTPALGSPAPLAESSDPVPAADSDHRGARQPLRTRVSGSGTPGRRPRRVLVGIAGAVVLASGIWFVQPRWDSWSAGSLGWLAAESTSRGVVEQVVVADFGAPAADPDLGSVVTDALRIDLLKAHALRVLDPSEVNGILEQMRVGAGAPITAELAREVALRAGVKAVLEGEIAQAGTGYVLTAALRSSASHEVLAAFRETARGPDEVIPAIDRLSRRIRRRAGESLESVRAAPALGRVTTTSLEALRLYTRADRASQRADYHQVLSLLDETLELDPEFAMAWRLLAVTLYNTGLDRTREVEAATRAYELRHRLGPRERFLAQAEYHSRVTHDRAATIEAYRRVLELDPDDPKALNNLALLYFFSNAYGAAAQLLERLVDLPAASAVAFANLTRVRIAQSRLEDARHAVDLLEARYPESPDGALARFWVLLLSRDEAGARAQLESMLDDPDLSPLEQCRVHDHLARLALWRGRLEEARHHLEAAEQIARDAGGAYHPLIWRLRRAHVEVAVGDPERGVGLVLDSIDGTSLDEVPPPERHHLLQSIILGMAGQPNEAEAMLRRFEAEVPPELHAGYRVQEAEARALLALQRGNAEGAVRILERVRESYPCRFCLADQMGWALRDAGRLDDAAREWETALSWKDSFNYLSHRLTQHLWVLPHAASLYEQLGDTARAIDLHRRVVEVWADADTELQPRVAHARVRIAALLAQQP